MQDISRVSVSQNPKSDWFGFRDDAFVSPQSVSNWPLPSGIGSVESSVNLRQYIREKAQSCLITAASVLFYIRFIMQYGAQISLLVIHIMTAVIVYVRILGRCGAEACRNRRDSWPSDMPTALRLRMLELRGPSLRRERSVLVGSLVSGLRGLRFAKSVLSVRS